MFQKLGPKILVLLTVLILGTLSFLLGLRLTVSSTPVKEAMIFSTKRRSSLTFDKKETAFETLIRELQQGNRTLCSELLDGNLTIPWTQDQKEKQENFLSYLDQIKRKSKMKVEGNSAQFPEEYKLFYKVIRAGFAHTVCETGFNAGHNTFMWFAADPHLHVYSFDLGEHKYTQPMAEHLQEMFPGRLNITLGDSRKTLPQLYKMNPQIKCDLVVIDGGHKGDVPMRDFENFYPMVDALSEHLILLDDWPSKSFPNIDKMWKNVTRSGRARTIAQCNRGGRTIRKIQRGLTFGMYAHRP